MTNTEPAGSAEPVELPPFPEPEFYVWMDAFNIQRMGRKAPEHVHSRPYFSTRQMRDYARTVMSTQSTHQPDVSIKAGESDLSDAEIMEVFDSINRNRLTNARSPWLESVLTDFAHALLGSK